MSQHQPENADTVSTSLVTKTRRLVEVRSWNYPAELIDGLSVTDPEALLEAYAANLQVRHVGRVRRTEVWLTVKDPEHGFVGLHFVVESFRVVHYEYPHWVFGGPSIDGSGNRIELHFVRGKPSLAVLIAEATLPEAE